MKGGENMNIGEKIKAARISKGLTQAELGELLGVQKSAIAKYENGRVVNIKRSTLQKISDVLGIRPAELISDALQEAQKNNDAISDIILKLRTDNDFLSLVKILYPLEKEQMIGVKQMLNAFLK